ncbi:MAG: hypothetical protein ABFC34_10780 [Methanobacterium sp.]
MTEDKIFTAENKNNNCLTKYDLNKPEKTIVLSAPYDSVTKEEIIKIKNLTR